MVMRIGVMIAALALTRACSQPVAQPRAEADMGPASPAEKLSASEPPVSARDAAALSLEFGLSGCSDMARLPDVRADGFLVESWRVRDDGRCFKGWSDRQERYAIMAHLDTTQTQRDRLPWICGESGGHVAQCSTQGRKVELLIEQPRGMPYLLFRRLTKVSA